MIGNPRLRRRRRKKAHADPMAGVANLSDVMLVFACGLMLAIIMFWKVDLSKVVDSFYEDDLNEVDNPEEILQSDESSNDYEQKGVVIQDTETGKMFVVEY